MFIWFFIDQFYFATWKKERRKGNYHTIDTKIVMSIAWWRNEPKVQVFNHHQKANYLQLRSYKQSKYCFLHPTMGILLCFLFYPKVVASSNGRSMPEKLSPVYCKLILSIICYSQEHLVTYETTHDLVKRIGLEESREKKTWHGNQWSKSNYSQIAHQCQICHSPFSIKDSSSAHKHIRSERTTH